jgi:hypothetical protein
MGESFGVWEQSGGVELEVAGTSDFFGFDFVEASRAR